MNLMCIEADDMLSALRSPSEFCFCHTSIISQSYLVALLQREKKKANAQPAEICRGLCTAGAVRCEGLQLK